MKTLKRNTLKTIDDLPKIPMLCDMLQEFGGNSVTPEIRVWCHPTDGSEVYYEVFESFEEAESFIKGNPTIAENAPLIAFRGFEINIYELPNLEYQK